MFCYHFSYGLYLPCSSQAIMIEVANYFHWQFDEKGMNLIPSVRAEYLSTMWRFGGPNMHISLRIRVSTMTCSVLNYIGNARTW